MLSMIRRKKRAKAPNLLLTLVATLYFSSVHTAVADEKPRPTDRALAAYYPPLMIDDGADMPGIAIEILRAAAKRANRNVQLEFQPFQRALNTIQESPDAVMAALFRNESREAQFQWIARIHATKLRFLAIDTQINSLEQARQLGTIGVEAGSTSDRFLSRLGFENLERVSSPDATAQMLAADRIDAWLLTNSLANSVWQRLDLKPPLISGDVIKEFPIYLVAGPSFPKALADTYRTAVEKLHQDGSIKAILARYE